MNVADRTGTERSSAGRGCPAEACANETPQVRQRRTETPSSSISMMGWEDWHRGQYSNDGRVFIPPPEFPIDSLLNLFAHTGYVPSSA
jgi:hypothetical protein